MSSEQVIAAVVAEMRGYGPDSGNGKRRGWPWWLIDQWADRLSTPAASTGDAGWFDLMRQIGDLTNCLPSTFPDGNEHIITAIRQLQARNANLAEVALHAASQSQNYQLRLRALLDGIEAAPVAEIDNSGDVTVLVAEGCGMDNAITAARIGALHGRRVYIISADNLALMRESSVPAIGET